MAPLKDQPSPPRSSCKLGSSRLGSSRSPVIGSSISPKLPTTNGRRRTTTKQSTITAPYTLNPKKTLQKKAVACDRSLVEINHKSGTTVLTFSATAFEVFRNNITNFCEEKGWQCSVTYTKDSKHRIVQDTIKVLIPDITDSLVHGVTINIFRTTTRVTVNGGYRPEFMEYLPTFLYNLYKMKLDIKSTDKKLMNTIMDAMKNIHEWEGETTNEAQQLSLKTVDSSSSVIPTKEKSSTKTTHAQPYDSVVSPALLLNVRTANPVDNPENVSVPSLAINGKPVNDREVTPVMTPSNSAVLVDGDSNVTTPSVESSSSSVTPTNKKCCSETTHVSPALVNGSAGDPEDNPENVSIPQQQWNTSE